MVLTGTEAGFVPCLSSFLISLEYSAVCALFTGMNHVHRIVICNRWRSPGLLQFPATACGCDCRNTGVCDTKLHN